MNANPNQNFVIRRAQAADAPGITRIIRAAWKEYSPDVSPRAIAAHTTYVATVNDKLVGFVDSFSTMRDDDNAEARWEIDWLAVDPAYHKRGVGTALVAAALEAGRAAGANVARALVRIGNEASEKAFERNGFARLPDVLAMYTSSIPLKDLRSVADHRASYIIPVRRLNDEAIWIEGELTDRVLQQARYMIGVRGWHAAGTLVPRTDGKALKLVEAEGYGHRGDYHQWIYRY